MIEHMNSHFVNKPAEELTLFLKCAHLFLVFNLLQQIKLFLQLLRQILRVEDGCRSEVSLSFLQVVQESLCLVLAGVVCDMAAPVLMSQLVDIPLLDLVEAGVVLVLLCLIIEELGFGYLIGLKSIFLIICLLLIVQLQVFKLRFGTEPFLFNLFQNLVSMILKTVCVVCLSQILVKFLLQIIIRNCVVQLWARSGKLV